MCKWKSTDGTLKMTIFDDFESYVTENNATEKNVDLCVSCSRMTSQCSCINQFLTIIITPSIVGKEGNLLKEMLEEEKSRIKSEGKCLVRL